MNLPPSDDLPLPRRRLLAIVGRPNVGKSAVFNRIAGRRIAIVHDESGVTRDRLMREVEWQGQRFELVDTGGVRVLGGEHVADSIEAGVRQQVDTALDEAAAAILVVDAQTGVHPIDAEVAQMVRAAGIPCRVAANKCDEPRHDAAAAEFSELGFPVCAVSALHDRGFDDLVRPLLAALPPEEPNPTVTRPLRVAVVGRPNAGKSSYINRLLRHERVIVSPIAGTTRDSIEVPFTIGSGPQARHYTLVDTAGMRHVHRIDSAVERFSLFRAERSVAEADVVVLVMDAEAGPTLQDKSIAALVQRHQKGCVLVVNKWDLSQANGITETKAEPALRAMMPFMNYCPVVFLSATEGYNVRRSIEAIDLVAAQTQRKLPTGLLNRVLDEAHRRVSPPLVDGKRLHIYYATQTGTAPITVSLFVNDAARAVRAYSEFLVRSLRENFGLEGAPVALRFRTRARPERAGDGTPAGPAAARHAPGTGDGQRPRHHGAKPGRPGSRSKPPSRHAHAGKGGRTGYAPKHGAQKRHAGSRPHGRHGK